MKEVDVLFLYETKVRELENICLLKYELERRGYSVGILNTWNELGKRGNPKFDAKVVVTHAMYHDGIYLFVKGFCGNVPKVVNMQCEQVGTIKDDETDDSRMILKGIASQCMNICWGDQTVERLKQKSGIDDKHLRKTGQITLDFCRKEFRGYYESRENLAETYSLPLDRKWNLFISSFAYVNLPEEQTKNSDIQDKEAFIQCSRKSFDGILQWFAQMLDEMPEELVIYRPHPAEADNPKLKALCDRYPDRFFVISQLSVKQWVAVADRVYTWYSSSGAEVYAFGVPFAILRPVEIPRDMEVALFRNASFVTDYDGFIDSIRNGIHPSVDPKVFERLYSVEDRMSYLRFADAIEDVLKDDSYLIRNPPKLPSPSLLLRVKMACRKPVEWVANRLPENIHVLGRYRKKKYVPNPYTQKLQKNNYASEAEIREIQEKIAKIVAQH